MGKIYWSKALTTATILIVLHQFAVASQWPYLQVYPPINETDGRTPLYFALVLSFGGDYKSIGVLPGVQIALDYINSQPSILPGYSLHYTLTDSQVLHVRILVIMWFLCSDRNHYLQSILQLGIYQYRVLSLFNMSILNMTVCNPLSI